MNKIISKTIKIISDTMPPKTSFIEEEIIKQGINPVRWAIVKADKNELTLNVSGEPNSTLKI